MTFDAPELFPVARGFQAGLIRCAEGIRGFDVAAIDLPQARETVVHLVRGTLQRRDSRWPGPGVEFLSEIVTVGVCARMHYRENPLPEETVLNFSAVFEEVANSLLHF